MAFLPSLLKTSNFLCILPDILGTILVLPYQILMPSKASLELHYNLSHQRVKRKHFFCSNIWKFTANARAMNCDIPMMRHSWEWLMFPEHFPTLIPVLNIFIFFNSILIISIQSQRSSQPWSHVTWFFILSAFLYF